MLSIPFVKNQIALVLHSEKQWVIDILISVFTLVLF